MKLYLTHSSGFDFKEELYSPLKKTLGQEHDIFYPHDQQSKGVKSKDIIFSSDAILAEVSHPSTGQGIELGWADSHNIPIICFYRTGYDVSLAISFITERLIEYKNQEDLIDKLYIVINAIHAR